MKYGIPLLLLISFAAHAMESKSPASPAQYVHISAYLKHCPEQFNPIPMPLTSGFYQYIDWSNNKLQNPKRPSHEIPYFVSIDDVNLSYDSEHQPPSLKNELTFVYDIRHKDGDGNIKIVRERSKPITLTLGQKFIISIPEIPNDATLEIDTKRFPVNEKPQSCVETCVVQ